MRQLWRHIELNWERILFGTVGAACLVFTFMYLLRAEIASASAVFAMSFFSFFYSNLARFKKFKGLGFEAELWEDKQKEAVHLIDRLKDVVAVYTREIVMNKVLRGRWGGSESWQQHWSLLNELQGRHTELGQQIDFSDLRRDVEGVFVYDLCSPLASSISNSIQAAKVQANQIVSPSFGNPITDIESYRAFQKQLSSIGSTEDQIFERAKVENVAQALLLSAQKAEAALWNSFSVKVEFQKGVVERLVTLTELIRHRPIAITPELITWADDHELLTLK